MFDIVCLVLALAGLVLVLQLRAVLGFVFPLYRVRVLPPGTAAPPDLQDLYAQAGAELKALGFEGPAWFWRDAEPQATSPEQQVAAYRHPEQGSVLWLLPPTYAHAANQLAAYASSRLVDGRLAISQAFDCYFATTAVGRTVVQTVAPASHAALAELHRQWLASLGAAVAPDSASPATILDTAALWMNRQRSQLLACGALWRDAAGVVRPRPRQAWRMLRAWWRQPRMPKDTAPVPVGRLVHFALMGERLAARPLPARMQWGFFSLSALAFALLGAWAWDWRYTLLLLLVIAIHEGGHYLAMRLFGYRHVHMVALPLLGGVTMGEEVKPSAARRAWTSLAGPLPGILIGWALLASAWGGWPWDPDTTPEVVHAALAFLLLNYLNLLPVPPLDGARIVQAMLRPSWAWVQAGFLVLACGVGMLAAFFAGMPLLGVLAALQLLTVRSLFRQGRLLKAASAQGIAPATLPHAQRLRQVFAQLEQLAGPAKTAAERVKQARALLQGADQIPLGCAQGSVLVAVLAVLLAFPVVPLMVLYAGAAGWSRPDAQQLTQWREQTQQIEQQSRALPLAELVAQLGGRNGQPPAPGASPQALQEAETRLSMALPSDMAAVWALADGLPDQGLAPLAQVRRAAREELEPLAARGMLAVRPVGPSGTPGEAPTPVTLEAAQRWLRLSGASEDERDTQYFYDPSPTPAVPGQRLILLSPGEGMAYPGLRAYLEGAWQSLQHSTRWEQRRAVQRTQLRAEWNGASVPQLLAKFHQGNWAQRLLLKTPPWPAAAPEAAIAAVEQRLATPLPADLRQLYQEHNGFPPLRIVPVERLARASAWPANLGQLETASDGYDLRPPEGAAAVAEPAVHLGPEDLKPCVVVASFHRQAPAGAQPPVPPSLWWCPASQATPERWVSAQDRRIYPSLRALLLHTAAARQAGRMAAY